MRRSHLAKAVLWGLIASLAMSWATFAAEGPASAPPEPSKEMRGKMAALHERTAACLRSERPFAECRNEMMKGCQELMGAQGCPMMGMHGRMMNGHPLDTPKEK